MQGSTRANPSHLAGWFEKKKKNTLIILLKNIILSLCCSFINIWLAFSSRPHEGFRIPQYQFFIIYIYPGTCSPYIYLRVDQIYGTRKCKGLFSPLLSYNIIKSAAKLLPYFFKKMQKQHKYGELMICSLFAYSYTIVDYKLEQYFPLTPNQLAVNNPRSFTTKWTGWWFTNM